MKYLLILQVVGMFAMGSCNSSKSPQPLAKVDPVDINFELEYKIREPKNLTQPSPLLVLLHGYGSNENDLFSFAPKIPDNWLVVTLRAPLTIGPQQYKWYNVKMVNNKITMNFEDQENSRQQILKFIDQLKLKYQIDQSKVVTAGFSQGANMAVGLALTEPTKISAAACFSGRFMEEIKPLITNKKALKGKQFFLAHGSQDNMLPLKYLEENQAILESYDSNIQLSIDQVAHSISDKQFSEFTSWLLKL